MSIALLIPAVISAEDCRYRVASTPVRNPPCTPTKGTHGTLSVSCSLIAALISSNPFIIIDYVLYINGNPEMQGACTGLLNSPSLLN